MIQDTPTFIALWLFIIAAVTLIIWLDVKYSGKKKKPSSSGNNQLITTIQVPRREEYQEEPEEESECGDSFPLDDVEGLFDPSKGEQDKQTLIDIARRQGFNIKSKTK